MRKSREIWKKWVFQNLVYTLYMIKIAKVLKNECEYSTVAFFDRELYSKVLKEALLWSSKLVHKISGIQSLSTKFVEINAVCPRN